MCRGATDWLLQDFGPIENPILGFETTNSATVTNRILTVFNRGISINLQMAVLIGESLQTFDLALLLGGVSHPNFFSCKDLKLRSQVQQQAGTQGTFFF